MRTRKRDRVTERQGVSETERNNILKKVDTKEMERQGETTHTYKMSRVDWKEKER